MVINHQVRVRCTGEVQGGRRAHLSLRMLLGSCSGGMSIEHRKRSSSTYTRTQEHEDAPIPCC